MPFLLQMKSFSLRRGLTDYDYDFFLNIHFMHKMIFAMDVVLGWHSPGANCDECCFSTTPRGAIVQQMVYSITQRAMHAVSIDEDIMNVDSLCKTINNIIAEYKECPIGPAESIDVVNINLSDLGYNIDNDEKHRGIRRNVDQKRKVLSINIEVR
ncbi:hypothetical protein PRIPAC_96185 [Pristionchus pacificus]|uniref:Uncharacterized protein n=1 Tax=Pristionchus pacificus TaxID=54126 RepID=A0A2A6BCC6_PRIPA|nr:hypothetical protein PRIPAC_96185 [Pristionchus pacificus]|eukprot:PDM63540.1 hypothetical protein PRIPAC_53897 [Pristionchus pacificus]